jgi:hypothetical protein
VGYYTTYTIDEIDGDINALIAVLHSDFAVYLERCSDGKHSVNCKWYEHENEMRLAMTRVGVSRIMLHLDGESRDDVVDKEFTLDPTTGLVSIRRFKGRWVRNSEPEQ